MDSRVSGLYRLSVAERIAALESHGWLSSSDARALSSGRQVVSVPAADKMVENVLGVFGLPFAIAPNFIVNGRECIVPLVVEEPSIVAGLSSAAAAARGTGGFCAELTESLLIGQIHIVGVEKTEAAIAMLVQAELELIDVANAVHPRLMQRGGGVRAIEFGAVQLQDESRVLAVHVLVDTCDAMGANLVNTIVEVLAPRIVALCGGEVALRILSNLTDRSICKATVRYGADVLASREMTGETVRDRIVTASDIAIADPYRATTHNKGVMNGIDALAIATGNDWRAIEAGAHAYAARSGVYSSLTKWSVGDDGKLVGEIEIPLKPGIVGGTLATNPGATLGLAMTAVNSAAQLAELMAAVGLAQNFAALRALATSGIQKGHMRLHARSVASAAGASDAQIDDVVDKLVESGEIKLWNAKRILAGASKEAVKAHVTPLAFTATAAGKVILLGEHAVVYGRHALGLPLSCAVRASVSENRSETSIAIDDWGMRASVTQGGAGILGAAIHLILDRLDLGNRKFSIEVASKLPRGMGLGSSAAIAVAITRAVAKCVNLKIDDLRVNEIAFECEKLAHGTPSGVDNALSCIDQPMLFRNSGSLEVQTLELNNTPPIVIGLSQGAGPTDAQVAAVRTRYDRDRARYNAIFDQIDDISQAGAAALTHAQYDELGLLMNVCHGLLNAIEVSTPELETMVSIARDSGALGAKMTGAGGGGSIVALCPGTESQVQSKLNQAGFRTLQITTMKEST